MTASKFVVSKSKVLEQYRKLKSLGLDISYSVKTFPEISPILEENTDSFFSIHMPQSLRFIKDKSRVWFLAQAWDHKLIENLLIQGIRNFVVDNETDLQTLLDYIGREKTKVNLLLRMKLKEHTIYTGKYFVFGMYSSQINRLIPELRKNKFIEKLGIHFHRKTQNTSEWDIKEEISQLLNEKTLGSIDLFNIGGGLPVCYKNTTDSNIGNIFRKIREFRDWIESEHGVKTIIEPGRFIAGPATKLVTPILSIYENNIIVDASIYNGALDTIIVPIKLLVEGELDQGKDYVIKGSTPCSIDIFRYNVKLKDPKVGDKIVFLNAGAYCFTTDFCNLPKLDIEFVE